MLDETSDKARELYDGDTLNTQIAKELNVSRSRVTKLLKHSFERDGQKMPYGRSRRSNLQRKQTATPVYQRISEEAKRPWDRNWSILRIARKLDTSAPTVIRAIDFWHESRDQQVPDISVRRREKIDEARRLYEQGHQQKELVEILQRSGPTIRNWLRQSFAAEGDTMPDGRTRLQQERS